VGVPDGVGMITPPENGIWHSVSCACRWCLQEDRYRCATYYGYPRVPFSVNLFDIGEGSSNGVQDVRPQGHP
jgi:hypothetical protein